MGMLEGKAVLVTGAGRGIGRGIAVAMARAGAKVVVNDFGARLDGEKDADSPADAVVAEIRGFGAVAEANHGSVADFGDAEAMVEQVVASYGRIDALVHVAGILRDRMIFNMTEAEWDAVIAVHLKGAFNCFRAAAVRMRAQKSGRLLAMASDSAYGAPGQPNYAAAKAGILGLAWSTARALEKYAVTTNVIVPNGATRMIDATPKARAMFEATGKWPSEMARGTQDDPDNVAPLAVYLASDRAGAVNGQVLFSQGYRYALVQQPEFECAVQSDGPWTPEALAEVFPSTLGARQRPPFNTDMFTFLGELPPADWADLGPGRQVWRRKVADQ